ncbi:unnamed protein product [Ectocarpus sp. CCAP 1310/34]|nr:unnamed protein product [Ectocarpus sp. CCAP 1310/34]
MAVSSTRSAKRAHSLASVTKRVSSLLDALAILGNLSALDAPTKRNRSTLVARERRPFETHIKPLLQDHTFSVRFRMEYDDFRVLIDHLRPALHKNEKMGLLRIGAIPVEYQIAMTLRWLAGGSIYECMDGHVIARSTAYHVTSTVINALNACPELNCKWPEARMDVVRKCVGAMDGLFVRMIKPSAKEVAEPNLYYNGHRKGVVVGDAAYGASERVVVPFPGTSLSASQDACNNYVSQYRMAIEQTYGILVRRWGILWRPMEVRIEKFEHVVAFDDDGLISSDYFETVPVRTGRPVKDQAKASKPREAIRKELEVAGLIRPEHNIARSHNRAS